MSWQASTTDSTLPPSGPKIGAAAISNVASFWPSRQVMISLRWGFWPRSASAGGSSSGTTGVPSR